MNRLLLLSILLPFLFIGCGTENTSNKRFSNNLNQESNKKNAPPPPFDPLIKSFKDSTSFQSDHSSGYVLVDFYVDWCIHCHIMAPFINSLAKKYEGRMEVKKLHCEENEAIAQKYQIDTYPTLILFKGGKKIGQVTGSNQEKVSQLLKQHIR